MARWNTGDRRSALNRHLYHQHGVVVGGNLEAKTLEHDRLHGSSEWNHYHPIDDDPSAFEFYMEEEGESG